MQLFDLKLTYIIESDIYKLGDLTIEFSKIYLSSEINKPKFFFCINNSYGHIYTYTNDFAKDVINNERVSLGTLKTLLYAFVDDTNKDDIKINYLNLSWTQIKNENEISSKKNK